MTKALKCKASQEKQNINPLN